MAEQTAFTVVSAISIVLILLPLPWHWSARNYGTLLYIGWTFIGCLMYFVNSIVWRGNLGDPAPIWCDISAKIAIGLSVALPAVSLCINRRLFNIATMKHASTSPRQKLYQALIDFGIGLGIPVFVMILHYIVQGHRYDIIEDMGCTPTTYPTPPAIPLVFLWAPLLGLISMIYSGLTILAFMKQRRTFNAVLNSNSSHINMSRYLRLMALAGTDLLLDIPLSVFILWSNVQGGLKPWISWSNVHYGFSYVNYFPAATLKAEPGTWAGITISRWALPVSSILFFLFFGLAGESLAFYRSVYERCTKPFHNIRIPSKLSLSRRPSFQMAPINIKVERTQNVDVEIPLDFDAKIDGYASLHSAPADRAVHVEFPDLERGLTRETCPIGLHGASTFSLSSSSFVSPKAETESHSS